MPWWKKSDKDETQGQTPSRRQEAMAGTELLPNEVFPTLQRGEQILASACDDTSGDWLVLTTFRFMEIAEDGAVRRERPWHRIDTGSWDPDTWTLEVQGVGEPSPHRWVLHTRSGPGKVPTVFRERTSASVVLVQEVDLKQRRYARVTIRTDLSNGELLEQVIPGLGVDLAADAELGRQVLKARNDLRDHVGMGPVEAG